VLAFYSYGDIDWDGDIDAYIVSLNAALDGDEQGIVDILRKRGASFVTALSSHKTERPLYEVLFSLMEKGVVHADSFTPVRQWLDRDKLAKRDAGTAKRRVSARVMAMTAGRWDLARPLVQLTPEQMIGRAFSKVQVLCRETAASVLGVPWGVALQTLRMWEYTGRARRGYFVEGLSGAQYIAEESYSTVVRALELPADDWMWLAASDPNQVWGKSLPHALGANFANLQGSAVALAGGVPVAVFERQGHTLRVMDDGRLPEALSAFAEAFANRRVFPALKRLTVKQYPDGAAEALKKAGFAAVMLDYVLHR
jgi:ATP-dependent Lhr-like helicase